jgi:hypothetical protein
MIIRVVLLLHVMVGLEWIESSKMSHLLTWQLLPTIVWVLSWDC